MDGRRTSETVESLLDDLTREEKLDLVRGAPDPEGTSTGYLPGVPRLDVPPLRLVDGPMGIRAGGFEDPLAATAFPASISLAATFDPELAREQGAAMAREAKARGQDAVLGPGVNLIRVPQGGRNFEYLSEEPTLSAAQAGAVVRGIQGEDAIATPKHYVANSQETDRVTVSSEVDERTLRELYLPAFRAAVDAGAGSVMTAYNRINGIDANDHAHLIRDVLKEEWGFQGYTVSDWFATRDAASAANGGLDLEMPGTSVREAFGEYEGEPDLDAIDPGGMPGPDQGGVFGADLAVAIEEGEVPLERLDDMVARVLRAMEEIGLLGDPRPTTERPDREGAIDTDDHRALAERIAVRGTVLLENDGVLPLADDADVALIGPNVDGATLGGGGSSAVTPVRERSPATAFSDREPSVTVEEGLPPVEGADLFDLFDGDGEEEVESDGREPKMDDAVAAAERAEVAVVVVGDTTTEGRDREDLRLPGRQDELVSRVADAGGRTVVVVNSGGPVEVPWREKVDAIAAAWYPGQADGAALTAVLYGDEEPGGRLPVTFAPEGEYPTSDERRYPGVDGEAHYEEGLFVGYRHFDAADAEATYPFGHGESYAEFAYGEPELVEGDRAGPGVAVRVPVENVADRPGREVVQVYVRPPRNDDRPVRELAGFASVEIGAGEERAVEMGLEGRAFSRWDGEEGWTVDPGTYTVEVGRSSGDLRTTVAVEIEP
ncbi:beta-glucosidase [Saliphagus sp. LR7]|uniref:beta-glucosidase family protein n=1 Tax=Saliphagus sp. LR7 TaxID=2282654 RepID=UPI0018E50091|nr:glycoside hydrolase family 3 C-terminal domain-containing protein [Saliphagus sp. LR7]